MNLRGWLSQRREARKAATRRKQHRFLRRQRADAETVAALFELILGRALDDDAFKGAHDGTHSLHDWIERLIDSDEFKARFFARHHIKPPSPQFIPDGDYRVPSLATPALPAQVLLTGSCLMDDWAELLAPVYPGIRLRRQLFNHASALEPLPDEERARTGFQVVQIPIRSLLPEAAYFTQTLSAEGQAAIERTFQDCLARLRRNLDAALAYNRASGLPVFVLNFAVPQANPLGRLLPKYSLSNLSHFVRSLNEALVAMVAAEKSVYVIDFDEITATLGKRYIQDDLVNHLNHGSFMDWLKTRHDTELTAHGDLDAQFSPKKREAVLATFNECLAAFSTISAGHKIKLVIFDLDGTLWRGVPADHDDIGHHLTEGWPVGMVEAAAFLKMRGILIAIASKNDPETAKRLWETLYGHCLPLSSFVSTQFSWGPKTESVATILRETNLLPEHCLFVDDNPVEREQVKLAFPTLQVIDGPINNWRRTLLWGTELQVPTITDESARRTESVQNMVQREALKATLDPAEYLRNLAVSVAIDRITTTDARTFARAFELLNKTNQFNSTGKRWTEAELAQFFVAGGAMLTAHVKDRHSDYGLAALLLARAGECTQIVMSCRVFGLNAEHALLAAWLEATTSEPRRLLLRDTGKNVLCRTFISNIGLPEPAHSTENPVTVPIPHAFTLDAQWRTAIYRDADGRTPVH
jgi:FkbH-like protein